MSKHNTNSAIEESEPSLQVPSHPFFASGKEQASFIDCIDAIDRVRAMIDLCNALELENEVGGGLTTRAALGFLWVSILSSETLGYTSDRLMELFREQRKQSRESQAQLSALLLSLPTLGKSNREHYLNSVAGHMDLNRSELDQFIHQQTSQ